MPSSMHWAVAMILVMVTFGIFGFILIFQQSSFVKKIDPKSRATTLWVVSLLLIVLAVVLIVGAAGFAAIAVQASNGAVGGLGVGMAGLMGIAMLVELTATVLCYVAIFGMRRSLVNYYNTVEPINLRLSAPMTFFFNLYYFQYHFARIAEWKKTGVLH